jgi:hypothetical protein
MMMFNGMVITFLLIFSNLSSANITTENNRVLEKLPDDFSTLALKEVGSAKFSVLFWDIYKSTLYTHSGVYKSNNDQDPLLFQIEYLKAITAKNLIKRTIEQWQHLKKPESRYLKFIPQLNAIWPDIVAGDKLSLFRLNGYSVFYFNNVKIGEIKQPEFSGLFLDIWLSPNTSQKKLRNKLIKGKNHAQPL